MGGKQKKATREKRMARGRKMGVGKPLYWCATWFNKPDVQKIWRAGK